jgi:transposase-like protein
MRVVHLFSTPQIQTTMAPLNNAQLPSNEGRIALAVQAIKQGQFSSVRAAAQAFDISKSTLSRRVKGVDARRDSIPINRKLTTIEELTLIE